MITSFVNFFFSVCVILYRLQIVSVTYEHENDPIRKAVRLIPTNTQLTTHMPIISATAKGVASNMVHQKVVPGGLLGAVFGLDTADEVAKKLDSRHDRLIRDWGVKFGIHFEVVSGR